MELEKMKGRYLDDVMTSDEIIESYDNNKTYMRSIVGIHTDDHVVGLEEPPTSMYIKRAFTILKYIPLTDNEKDLFNTQVKVAIKEDRELGAKSPYYGKDIELVILLDNKYIKSTDGKLYKLYNAEPTINSIFFKTDRKCVKDNREIDSNYYISDPDYRKHMYKTWIFTNVDPKEYTIHSMDRANRPGLVMYKPDITEKVYRSLDIPEDVKGIFVVRDNILARPEFTTLGLNKYGRDKDRTLIDIQGLKHTIESMDREVSKYKHAPVIEPLEEDRYETLLENRYFKKRKNYTGVKTFYGEIDARHTIPLSIESANLFNRGIDRAYIDTYGDRDELTSIKRWEGIVRSYYNNRNCEIFLGSTDEKVCKNFNSFLRNDIGKISNYVVKEPNNYDEARMYTPKITKDYTYTASGDLVKAVVEGGINVYENQALTYSELLDHETSLNNLHCAYDLGLGAADRHNLAGYLGQARNEVASKLLYKNGITFQDVVFIPIEKLINNHGKYYDVKTDFLFLIDKLSNSRVQKHPSNEKHAMDYNSNNGVDVKVLTNNEAILNTLFYTNVYGKIDVLKPMRAGEHREEIKVIRTSLTGSTIDRYDVTEDNFKKVGLYRFKEDAECHGLRPEYLEALKYTSAKTQYENKAIISNNNVDISKVKLETAKVTKEANTLQYNLKFRQTLTEFEIKYHQDAIRFKNELETLRVKHEADKAELAIKKSMLTHKLEYDQKTEQLKLQKSKIEQKSGIVKTALDTLGFLLRLGELIKIRLT